MSETISQNTESITGPQIVPHSREAEEAVIGSILINPDAYYDVVEFLQAEDFYLIKHRWVFEAFNRLHERRTPIDMLTVTEELDQMGYLGEVGGAAYLTTLISNVPTALHATAYGHMVEETAIRRRMLEAANEIAKAAYKENITIDTAINSAEKAVFGVSERRLSSDLQPIQKVLSDYYDRVGDLANRDAETYGVPTNFRDLDNLLGGHPTFRLVDHRRTSRPGQNQLHAVHREKCRSD
jgi:replicative DNA helicase